MIHFLLHTLSEIDDLVTLSWAVLGHFHGIGFVRDCSVTLLDIVGEAVEARLVVCVLR